MKKIIFGMVVAAMMCMMTACESGDVRNGRELYKLYLNKTLIAPEDMHIYGESFEQTDSKIIWSVDVGGTTRGGGKFRKTMRFETIGGGMITVVDGDGALNRKMYSKTELQSL